MIVILRRGSSNLEHDDSIDRNLEECIHGGKIETNGTIFSKKFNTDPLTILEELYFRIRYFL